MLISFVSSMCDISVISKSLAWSVHNDKVIAPELDKIDMIKELLHVEFGHSFLLHFDSADIDIVIEQLCSFFNYFSFICTVCTIFHNKYI